MILHCHHSVHNKPQSWNAQYCKHQHSAFMNGQGAITFSILSSQADNHLMFALLETRSAVSARVTAWPPLSAGTATDVHCRNHPVYNVIFLLWLPMSYWSQIHNVSHSISSFIFSSPPSVSLDWSNMIQDQQMYSYCSLMLWLRLRRTLSYYHIKVAHLSTIVSFSFFYLTDILLESSPWPAYNDIKWWPQL